MADSNIDTGYAVSVRGLEKSFGNFSVLRGLDLNVEKGGFYTLFGPNGSGKTTFLRILSTIGKADSGELRINGLDALSEKSAVRGSIGVVWHEPSVYDNLSAFENIIFFGTMYGVSDLKDRASSLLGQLGLGIRQNDLVRTYSRGMKQRLAVARAIVHDPPVLLLDEPYTGLDTNGSRIFGELLRSLYSRERTIIMTTHNMDEGLDLSTRAGILNDGRIVSEVKSPVDRESFREQYLSIVNP